MYFAIWFGVSTVLVVLRFLYQYLDDLARQIPGTWLARLIEEVTGGYTASILFVFVIFFALRFRLQRHNWLRRLPVYLLVMIGYSILHTTLMAVTRQAIFPLVGLGKYYYGIMPIRYAMEFASQTMFFWITVAFTHLIAHYRETRDRELKTAQLEAELAQAQLQTLQSQLQPHFLFNALNTISAVIYEDVQTADAMIARLSNFLRQLLNTSESQEVTLQEELNFLNLYLDIMRPRFEERLNVEFEVESSAQAALVPKLILQPLVENSIKYAADPISGMVNIEVCAVRLNGDLLLHIKDKGPGLQTTQATMFTKGFGLSNTRERLKHLYGEHHEFAFRNVENGGLLIQVKVPFHLSARSGDL
jgi:LytS/YehU family sensor histidine kinase